MLSNMVAANHMRLFKVTIFQLFVTAVLLSWYPNKE